MICSYEILVKERQQLTEKQKQSLNKNLNLIVLIIEGGQFQ